MKQETREKILANPSVWMLQCCIWSCQGRKLEVSVLVRKRVRVSVKSLESQLLLRACMRQVNVSHCPPEVTHARGMCLLQAPHVSRVSRFYLAITVWQSIRSGVHFPCILQLCQGTAPCSLSRVFQSACFHQRLCHQHPLGTDFRGLVVQARTGSPRALSESCPGFMAPTVHFSKDKFTCSNLFLSDKMLAC